MNKLKRKLTEPILPGAGGDLLLLKLDQKKTQISHIDYIVEQPTNIEMINANIRLILSIHW